MDGAARTRGDRPSAACGGDEIPKSPQLCAGAGTPTFTQLCSPSRIKSTVLGGEGLKEPSVRARGRGEGPTFQGARPRGESPRPKPPPPRSTYVPRRRPQSARAARRREESGRGRGKGRIRIRKCPRRAGKQCRAARQERCTRLQSFKKWKKRENVSTSPSPLQAGGSAWAASPDLSPTRPRPRASVPRDPSPVVLRRPPDSFSCPCSDPRRDGPRV